MVRRTENVDFSKEFISFASTARREYQHYLNSRKKKNEGRSDTQKRKSRDEAIAELKDNERFEKDIRNRDFTLDMNLVIGALFFYINPLLTSLGLALWQVALSALLANALSTICRALFGSLADVTKRLDLVSGVLSFVTCGSILMFSLVPKQSEFYFEGRIFENGTFMAMVTTASSNATGSFETPCWPSGLYNCKAITNINGSSLPLPDYFIVQNEVTYDMAQYNPEEAVQLPLYIVAQNRTVIICEEQHFMEQNTLCLPIDNEGRRAATVGVFLIAVLLRCILSAAHAPILNLMDSATYTILGEKDASKFGRSRMFGSVGHITSALSTGYWIYQQEYPTNVAKLPSGRSHNTISYTPSILLGAAFAMFGIVAGLKSPKNASRQQSSYRKAIQLALGSPQMIKCLINAFLSGLIITFLADYTVIILTTEYQVPHFFFGLMIAMQVMSEIPALMIAGLMVEKFGETVCLVLAYSLWALRLYLYTLASNYWIILGAQLLYGPSFTLAYNTIMAQSASASRLLGSTGKADVLVSMQALASAVLFGFSSCIGGFLWGMLLEVIDGERIFGFMAIYCVVVAALTPLNSWCVDRIAMLIAAKRATSSCTEQS